MSEEINQLHSEMPEKTLDTHVLRQMLSNLTERVMQIADYDQDEELTEISE